MHTLSTNTPLQLSHQHGSPVKSSKMAHILPLNASTALSVANVPKGTAFINGRWSRVKESPTNREGDASHSRQDSIASVESEEDDPFADISDDEFEAAAANGGSAAMANNDHAHVANLKNPLSFPPNIDDDDEIGDGDINESDISFSGLPSSVASSQLRANGLQAANGDDVEEEEEVDPFAGIEDLPSDPAEDAARRAAEIARTQANRTAEIRKKLDKSKKSTLRPQLMKHMEHGDDDEDDIEAMMGDGDEDALAGHGQQKSGLGVKSSSSQSPVTAANVGVATAKTASSPAKGSSKMTVISPTSFAANNASKSGTVTAFTSRKEGQPIAKDVWSDGEADGFGDEPEGEEDGSSLHHRMSSKPIDDRPDDLDGLDDFDDEDLSLGSGTNHTRTPTSMSPISKSTQSISSSNGFEEREYDDDVNSIDDPHTPEPSSSSYRHHHRKTKSSGSSTFTPSHLRVAPHSGSSTTSFHSISSSMRTPSSSSVKQLSGQLSHMLQDEDDLIDDLDELMMDEEEDESLNGEKISEAERMKKMNEDKAKLDRATKPC